MADRTESSILVDAAPAGVLDVIADFDAYPEWTGAVRSAEVLEEDEDGWAAHRPVRARRRRPARHLHPRLHVGLRRGRHRHRRLDPRRGGHPQGDGRRLPARRPAGGTDVTYLLSVELKMPMLGMLRRKAEKTIIDTALKELKKRAEG